MGKEINFKAGSNVTLIPDTANGVIIIKGPASGEFAVTQNQRDALDNPEANENNKFITINELTDFIQGGSDPLSGFPLLLTVDENFQVSQSGRYRFTAVGGGGAGAIDSNMGTAQDSVAATPTIIKIGNKTFTARAGHTATDADPVTPEFPYDGIRGATMGGAPGRPAESAVGAGGASEGGSSGGAGSPFPKGETLSLAGSGFITTADGMIDLVGHGGMGYGAGGSSYGSAAGGSSGYLLVKEIVLLEREMVNITIGKGATGAVIMNNGEAICGSGKGADGAVLIEQV